jgi:RNA polymerase sigma factor (sigma-70 family)
MADALSTCWTLIDGAARGNRSEGDQFALIYGPVVGSYLAARWRGTSLASEVGDGIQEVMLECIKEGGALTRVDRERPGGFRAFLHGVARNVASRAEARGARRQARGLTTSFEERRADPKTDDPDHAFDRAWARAVMQQAAVMLERRAIGLSVAAIRRVDILRLRFGEGLPVRDIAARLGVAVTRVQKDYATAREEFRAALADVVAFHHPGDPAAVEGECRALLALLE